MNKCTSYFETATMAARFETEGNYAQAEFLWRTARNLAKKTCNELWCQARADICERKSISAFSNQ